MHIYDLGQDDVTLQHEKLGLEKQIHLVVSDERLTCPEHGQVKQNIWIEVWNTEEQTAEGVYLASCGCVFRVDYVPGTGLAHRRIGEWRE